MRRREFIAFIFGVAVARSRELAAQQPDHVRHVAVISPQAATDPLLEDRLAALRSGLTGLGWMEGRNLQIDAHLAGGDFDQMRADAAEVVRSAPDVILASGTAALVAIERETRTIPVVVVYLSDPLGTGVIKSLAHPGGNVTGFSNFDLSLISKWLQLLKEVVPSIRRVLLLANPNTSSFATYLRDAQSMGPSFAVDVIGAPVRDDATIVTAIGEFAHEPGGGVIVLPDGFTSVHRDQIVDQVTRYRLPAIYPYRYFVTRGGLMSYGIDPNEPFRVAASYIDRILRGAKPADLPMQAPTKFEFVINLKTAKALGLAVPSALLTAANDLIE